MKVLLESHQVVFAPVPIAQYNRSIIKQMLNGLSRPFSKSPSKSTYMLAVDEMGEAKDA